jgi:hypothetical protein
MSRNQNLPFATDEECERLRHRLVGKGRIVPAGDDPDPQAMDVESLVAESATLRTRRNASEIPEEGVYRTRRIGSDKEYERRKRNYFDMLQSVLRARRELGLEFGDVDDNDRLDDV